MKKIALVILVLAVYALHQDFWNWKDASLVGFLPVGLAYHAAYSILCAILMFVLVKFAWPSHLEDVDGPAVSVVKGEGQRLGSHGEDPST